jgi:Family of unknown function (DUF5677)
MNNVHTTAREIGKDLVDLVYSFLPIIIAEADGDPLNQLQWIPVRMAGTLRSILTLGKSGQHEDSAALVRVMADHLIMFGWLLADPKPPSRINAWKNDDLRLTAVARDSLEKFGFELEEPLPSVSTTSKTVSAETAARQCDEFWEPHLAPFVEKGTINSFSGLYALVFRGTSPYVHPSMRGSLGFFMTHTSNPGKLMRIAKSYADIPFAYADAVAIQLLATWILVARFRPADTDRVIPFFQRIAALNAAAKQS